MGKGCGVKLVGRLRETHALIVSITHNHDRRSDLVDLVYES